MPRKTELKLISERAVADPHADAAAAALEGYSLAPPQDVLTQLRQQNAQLTALVGETAGRADQAEGMLQQMTAAAAVEREQITRAANAQVANIRDQAANAIKAATGQGAIAPKPAMVAAQVRQASGFVAQLISFLVDRAPVLATLTGAFVLARDMLPDPGVMQLGLLGIYGAVGVAPAVMWSLRRK